MESVTSAVFLKVWYTEILITDQGLELNARPFLDYLKVVGIYHQRTTPYNLQSNGRTERFSWTFKTMIGKQVNNRQDTWDHQLGIALTAYNNSSSTVTGHTTFFLMFGRRAQLPLFKMLHLNTPLEG